MRLVQADVAVQTCLQQPVDSQWGVVVVCHIVVRVSLSLQLHPQALQTGFARVVAQLHWCIVWQCELPMRIKRAIVTGC